MIESLLHSSSRRFFSGPRAWMLPVLGSGLVAWAMPAHAQVTADAYFPTGNYGYDQNLGVTVLTRARPEYEQGGVQLGGFTVNPELDQSIFDNTNVNGTAGSNTGSWGTDTRGSITGQSDWERNSLQATVGFDHSSFFQLPVDNFTNWNVGIGGGYTIAGGQLRATYSHSVYYQLGTQIGAASSEKPTEDITDSGEISYDFNFGRLTVTPSLDFSVYRSGDITNNGVTSSQSYLDRDVIAGGVVTRYALTGGTGLLLVARGSGSNYYNQTAGQINNNSTSGMVLAGFDYQPASVWRYSFLVGVEHTTFAAAQYGSETVPVISGQVVWSPDPVLTVVGNLSRSVQDTDVEGSNGYIQNQARFVGDYELKRNVLLEGRMSVQNIAYFQSGTQTSESIGGGVTWLLNRTMQLSLNDDFTNQNAPSSAVTPGNTATTEQVSGAYTQNVLMLTLRCAL